MTRRRYTMAHPVMWFEILGNNGGKLRNLNEQLFGWTYQVLDGPVYVVVATGDKRGIPGGVGSAPAGSGWVTFYTETADVTASLGKAVSLGGKIVMPRTELPGAIVGVFADPEGHLLGLVEAAPPAAQ